MSIYKELVKDEAELVVLKNKYNIDNAEYDKVYYTLQRVKVMCLNNAEESHDFKVLWKRYKTLLDNMRAKYETNEAVD